MTFALRAKRSEGSGRSTAFLQTLSSSLRHGDRDDFDTAFAEFTLLAARTGVGQAEVSMIETAVALLDGRLADAERLAFDALATLHPGIDARHERHRHRSPSLGV